MTYKTPYAAGRARGEVLRRQALVRTLAKAHGARSVELFGSAARDEDGPGSDLDFLVELEPGRSLLDLIGLAEDLQEALGRNIAGMRDRLAHKYWLLDDGIVWAVVEKDLPKLRKAIRQILKPSSG